MATKDKKAELLGAISTQWIDRHEIAQKLGKKRLNPLEIAYLEELVMTGAIRRKIQTAGIAEKFVYAK